MIWTSSSLLYEEIQQQHDDWQHRTEKQIETGGSDMVEGLININDYYHAHGHAQLILRCWLSVSADRGLPPNSSCSSNAMRLSWSSCVSIGDSSYKDDEEEEVAGEEEDEPFAAVASVSVVPFCMNALIISLMRVFSFVSEQPNLASHCCLNCLLVTTSISASDSKEWR